MTLIWHCARDLWPNLQKMCTALCALVLWHNYAVTLRWLDIVPETCDLIFKTCALLCVPSYLDIIMPSHDSTLHPRVHHSACLTFNRVLWIECMRQFCLWCRWLFSSYASLQLGGSLDESMPAWVFLFLFFFFSKCRLARAHQFNSLRQDQSTVVLASWDDCGQVSPEDVCAWPRSFTWEVLTLLFDNILSQLQLPAIKGVFNYKQHFWHNYRGLLRATVVTRRWKEQ